ncbi:phosphotransferase enzyme family protein [Aspergillus unguis]
MMSHAVALKGSGELQRKYRRKPRAAYMSIWCRGKPITHEELFHYTNGRFLADEKNQFDRRYVKFNLQALCDVAAAAGDTTSSITTIEKLEGGFSKALLMTKKDGHKVIAKIPCRIAGPAFVTTASEVGVLEYLKRYTTIPVPRVFSWYSDSFNPVGAEYIVMEKAPGVPLFERRGKMLDIEKLELIKQLTQLEAQLLAMRFPAYGGLFLRSDSGRFERCRELQDSLFCVGPSPERSFAEPTSFQGPWDALSDLGVAIANREISRIKSRPEHKKPSPTCALLEMVTGVMKRLDLNPVLAQVSQPTLWHTDLHMGNIFVDPADNSRITTLIDVQSQSILPLFLQAQWPVFLKPPHNYPQGIVQPQLPVDFETYKDNEKAAARQEWEQAKAAKAYEVSTILQNKIANKAMNIPRVFRELFIRAGEASDVASGAVPLRECLIEIFQNWADLGFTGDCPYSFSKEEISMHEQEFADYREWNDLQQAVMQALDTDAEGWVAPQVDFEMRKRQNRELLDLYLKEVKASGEMSTKQGRSMWPFPMETVVV